MARWPSADAVAPFCYNADEIQSDEVRVDGYLLSWGRMGNEEGSSRYCDNVCLRSPYCSGVLYSDVSAGVSAEKAPGKNQTGMALLYRS